MPLPPPPAAAFSNTGNPTARAAAAMEVGDWSDGVSPGTTGTPAAIIVARAAVLDPMLLITAAGGPTNVKPACAQASANSARSDRKP